MKIVCSLFRCNALAIKMFKLFDGRGRGDYFNLEFKFPRGLARTESAEVKQYLGCSVWLA